MRQRHTKSRRNKRRSHLKLVALNLAVCGKCGQQILPHRACPNCGSFKGREVIDVLKKLDKKERKKKEKELESQEKETKSEGVNMENLSMKA